jgi:hypothetical protein
MCRRASNEIIYSFLTTTLPVQSHGSKVRLIQKPVMGVRKCDASCLAGHVNGSVWNLFGPIYYNTMDIN